MVCTLNLLLNKKKKLFRNIPTALLDQEPKRGLMKQVREQEQAEKEYYVYIICDLSKIDYLFIGGPRLGIVKSYT